MLLNHTDFQLRNVPSSQLLYSPTSDFKTAMWDLKEVYQILYSVWALKYSRHKAETGSALLHNLSTLQPSINTFYGLFLKGFIFPMRLPKWHWERVWTVGRSHRHRQTFKDVKIKQSTQQYSQTDWDYRWWGKCSCLIKGWLFLRRCFIYEAAKLWSNQCSAKSKVMLFPKEKEL